MQKNKVKFNLKNVHYAKLTMGENNIPTYETPVPIPGAVSLSLDASGEPENFYADGIAYYVINNNMGYSGDLEVAIIPESFRTDILKEELDSNGVLVEKVIRSISVMRFITARLPAPVLKVIPMRNRRKSRRKHLRSRRHLFRTAG